LALKCREDEHVDVEGEQLAVVDRCGPGSTRDRPGLLGVALEHRNVESVGMLDAAGDIGDRDHSRTSFMEQSRGRLTDVPVSLDRDTRGVDRGPATARPAL